MELLLEIQRVDKKDPITKKSGMTLDMDEAELAASALPILLDTDREVVKSLIKGTVMRDIVFNISAAKKLPNTPEDEPKNIKYWLVIYMHAHVNSVNGEAPTKNEMVFFMDTIKKYFEGTEESYRQVFNVMREKNWDNVSLTPEDQAILSDPKTLKLVEWIDTQPFTGVDDDTNLPPKAQNELEWGQGDRENGRRRFIKHYVQHKRWTKWQVTVDGKVERIPNIHADKPMPAALGEVGFSGRPANRKHHHRRHETIRIMHLVSNRIHPHLERPLIDSP